MEGGAWLAYALGAFFSFGATNFLLKYASARGVPPVEGTVVVWISTGLVGLATMIAMLVTGHLDPRVNARLAGVNFKDFAFTAAAGVALATGMYFLKAAVAAGKAGPATAVALSNAVLVAVLSWAILGEKLSTSELVGMAFYLLAVAVFALKSLG